METVRRAAVALVLASVASVAGANETRDRLWQQILARRVDRVGDVHYRTLARRDRKKLAEYLESLSRTDPAALGSDERIAFWINAYNAAVVSAIVHGRSPETVEQRARLFHWHATEIAGRERTIDEIQEAISPFAAHDPRIYFALSNGARGGPRLLDRPYRGDRLDADLARAARAFANDGAKNRFDPLARRIRLSPIFRWYREDFERAGGSIRGFLEPLLWSPIAKSLLEDGAPIGFLDFDWTLNAAPGERP